MFWFNAANFLVFQSEIKLYCNMEGSTMPFAIQKRAFFDPNIIKQVLTTSREMGFSCHARFSTVPR